MNITVGCAYPLADLYANVRVNSAYCSNWMVQPLAHDGHAVLVGGGPSLADNLGLIKWRHSLGQKIFALNGACKYLNRHGIVPDYQVFLDANKEMGDRIGEAQEYLVASQCDPALFQALPQEKIQLWHFALPDLADHLPDTVQRFSIVGAGGTVGLTAMCLAFMMGYRKLHLFGYDCSNRAGSDHAYEVPQTQERVGDDVFTSVQVTYGAKTFDSTLSMVHQAEMFPKVCNNLIDAGTLITVDVDKDCLLTAVMQDVRANSAQAA